MAGVRFLLDLFVPEDVYAALPSATRTAIRDRIRQLKSYAVQINAGAANQEATTRATWHLCRHDEGGACDPEVEI